VKKSQLLWRKGRVKWPKAGRERLKRDYFLVRGENSPRRGDETIFFSYKRETFGKRRDERGEKSEERKGETFLRRNARIFFRFPLLLLHGPLAVLMNCKCRLFVAKTSLQATNLRRRRKGAGEEVKYPLVTFLRGLTHFALFSPFLLFWQRFSQVNCD